jgi:hypothetical protein
MPTTQIMYHRESNNCEKKLIMLNKQFILAITAISVLALPFLSANAGEKPFPHKVTSLFGSLPEGFTIGKGSTGYDGSIDGSIYKVDLRNEVG